jgi:hypothetical protein
VRDLPLAASPRKLDGGLVRARALAAADRLAVGASRCGCSVHPPRGTGYARRLRQSARFQPAPKLRQAPVEGYAATNLVRPKRYGETSVAVRTQ